MKNKILVSIIVPVYKVEKYLDKCVHSIVSQTYKNLEIILVDDGSPDNCPAMCDEWAKKDERIKVIHKPNGGLSSARNAGLETMTGEFVCFIDSDDWIEPTYVENLLTSLNETNSDISCCGLNYIYDDYYLNKALLPQKSFVLDNTKTIFNGYYNKKTRPFIDLVTNKLYKSHIFNSLRFSTGYVYEDEIIILNILKNTNKLCIVKEALYNYYQRNDSIMNSKISNVKLKSMLYQFDVRIPLLIDLKYKHLLKYELLLRFNDVLWAYKKITNLEDKTWFRNEILNKWKEYKKYINIFHPQTIKILIRMFLLKINKL